MKIWTKKSVVIEIGRVRQIDKFRKWTREDLLALYMREETRIHCIYLMVTFRIWFWISPTYGWSCGHERDWLGWVCKLQGKEGWGQSPGNDWKRMWALETIQPTAACCSLPDLVHFYPVHVRHSIQQRPEGTRVHFGGLFLCSSFLYTTASSCLSLPELQFLSALLSKPVFCLQPPTLLSWSAVHLIRFPSCRGRSPVLPVAHCLNTDVSCTLSRFLTCLWLTAKSRSYYSYG